MSAPTNNNNKKHGPRTGAHSPTIHAGSKVVEREAVIKHKGASGPESNNKHTLLSKQ